MKKFALLLVIALILTCFGNVLTGVAFADTVSIYSDVLEDLQKDETFDVAQFPESSEEKMDVFQVAESNAGELFLYVYSPTKDKFTASEVRISTSIGDNLAPEDYGLTFLSQNGTLSKYIVNDLQVKPDTVRYYVIVQIARPWDNDVDGKQSSNIVTTVPYAVGKQFTACTIDGNVTYSVEIQEVIAITSKRVGYLRYEDKSKISWLAGVTLGDIVDSHYVAFSTNKPIDKLYEIEISYYTIACVENKLFHVSSGKTEKTPVFVHEEFQADNFADVNVFNKHYTWKRISTKDDFIQSETLTDEAKNELENMSWVLRFCETDVSKNYDNTGSGHTSYTRIDEVTILRLKFDINGTTYNLGVIDNKQSESPEQKPDNDINGLLDRLRNILDKIEWFFAWLGENWWVIIVAVVVVALIITLCIRGGRKILAIMFKAIGKALWWFIKYFAIGLFYVVTSPYWIIRAIVLKARERKYG